MRKPGFFRQGHVDYLGEIIERNHRIGELRSSGLTEEEIEQRSRPLPENDQIPVWLDTVRSLENGEYYHNKLVQDMQRLNPKTEMHAQWLAYHTPLLLENGHGDLYDLVVDTLIAFQKNKNREDRIDLTFSIDLTTQVQRLEAIGKGYARHVLERVKELARIDVKMAETCWRGSQEFLKTCKDPPADLDLLLISSIQDLYTAHLVGQVIDKTKYGKQYAEKCAKFY